MTMQKDAVTTSEDPWTDFKQDKARFGDHPWLLQPALYSVAIYRLGRWTLTAPPVVRRPAHGLYFVLYSIVRLCTGIEIPRTVRIGPGLMIHHTGGIVVSSQVIFGSGCTLRNGVTVGVASDNDDRVPVIGDRVSFGAHAVAIGNIAIGDDVTVGAGSVVIKDCPAGSTVVGVPARILPRRETAATDNG
jgi:serine O-acetyltransferase